MNYVHLPDLGVPRDIRAKAISTGSRDVIWSWYDEYAVRPYVGVNLHRFFNEVEHPAAFVAVHVKVRNFEPASSAVIGVSVWRSVASD